MYILVHYLGMSEKECPFYSEESRDRAELLLERVLVEGSARSKSGELRVESRVSYLRRKWITFQLRIEDYRLQKSYASVYARHMLWSAIVHGIERTVDRK